MLGTILTFCKEALYRVILPIVVVLVVINFIYKTTHKDKKQTENTAENKTE